MGSRATSPVSSRPRTAKTTLAGIAAAAVAGVTLTALPTAAGAIPDRAAGAAQVSQARQMEKLDRSPVAVAQEGGVYVGWRMLGLDPDDVAFAVYRDGQKITDKPLTGSTNLVDKDGTKDSAYQVATIVDGREAGRTGRFRVWSDQSLEISLDKPADGVTPTGAKYTYRANDASVGDIDGDGTYEIIQKWDPSNSQDNSRSGYTGNVYVDAYKMDGTRLWRIDLGRNIRAGAHYTQMMVYDLNSDGKAEIVMKTADGTVDGKGKVIGDASLDHRDEKGYVLKGDEFLTVFEGESGAAVDTIDYIPGRGNVCDWGDCYGNRADRFLASVAYLDGKNPSVIFSRGYYTRTVLASFDFDGQNLEHRWTFDSNKVGKEYAGQGNHQMSVADVDGDGKDETVFGQMTVDDDGSPLYSTKLGHGDALHVSDFDPSRPGQEVFGTHESMSQSGNRGATFRDAATGEILYDMPSERDTGRGAAGDIDPGHPGAEGWAVTKTGAWDSREGQLRAADGTLVSEKIPAANHMIWWDADPLREILNHEFDETTGVSKPYISKWNWEANQEDKILRPTDAQTNNGTKGNPALQADLFGDWREEVLYRSTDSTKLRLFTTTEKTEHRIRTLMHDPQYRLGIAWQNTAYNQPPHTGFFLGDGMEKPRQPAIRYTS